MQRTPKPPRSVYSDIWSVGIIIWACVSNSIPFNYQDENAETNIKAVRKAIAENKMPWSSVPHNLIPRKILQLVASCCNPRPKLRPSATEVASALWDVMILPPLEMSLATSAEEETKARVSDILDQGRKSALFISQEDEQVLRSLEAQQDPVASYLLGLAIWFKHIKPESEVEEFLMLPNVEPGLERRARSALVHLETAMRYDHKSAVKYLVLVHDKLSELYQKQGRQYIDLKSLPRELM